MSFFIDYDNIFNIVDNMTNREEKLLELIKYRTSQGIEGLDYGTKKLLYKRISYKKL